MAHSNSFFGLRRGSTKSMTFSVLRGQQITKDRVYDVANPRSDRQMLQRAIFATAVKFYKHANQAFFKFAFEDRKPNESEYNAFMRHNVANSVIFAKDVNDNDMFPAVGNGWMLSNGSLPSADINVTAGGIYTVLCPSLGDDAQTIGALAQALIADYGLQAGDIMTTVRIASSVSRVSDTPRRAPQWIVDQHRLDPASTETLADAGIVVQEGGFGFIIVPGTTTASGLAVVFSRVTAGKPLQVSTSYVINNPVAQSIVAEVSEESYIQQALSTWGASGDAILQGSLSKEFKPVPTPETITVSSLDIGGSVGSVTSNIVTLFGSNKDTYKDAVLEVAFAYGTEDEEIYRSIPYLVTDRQVPFSHPNIYMDLRNDEEEGDVAGTLYLQGVTSFRLLSLTVNGVKYNFATA